MKAGGKSADAKGVSEAPAPHWLGHRDRLRGRFEEAGPASLQDYELLEMLLFYSNRRGDTKGHAKALLAQFGSLDGVLRAPPAQLQEVPGIGPSATQLIGLVRDLAARTQREVVRQRDVMSSWSAVIDYARTRMGHLEKEEFRILFLDKKNNLLRDEVQGKGTVDHTPVYPREVIKRALELSASALVLVHNHPSGDPTPSRADIEMTRQIMALAEPMGITIHDHIIIAGGGHCSMKGQQLI